MMRNKLIILSFMFTAFSGFVPFSSYAEDAVMGESVGIEIPEGTLPSATFEVEATQVRLLIGGAKGKGVLHYNGTDYTFTLSAGGIGGVGYAEVKATGDVYFLEKVEDFAGNYSVATAGAALGKGTGVGGFRNAGNKVQLVTKTESEGVGLFLGLAAMQIELDK